MTTDQDLHLLWERMRDGHPTQAAWYPDPCPAMTDEDDDAYTKRLTGYTSRRPGGQYPYDHRRYRECSLGYHLTGSCRRGESDCECPCHKSSSAIDIGSLATDARNVEDAADILADLYYLPRLTAWQVMRDAAEAIRLGFATDLDGLRRTLSRRYQSPIGPWFAQDVVSILAKHAPSLPTLKATDDG